MVVKKKEKKKVAKSKSTSTKKTAKSKKSSPKATAKKAAPKKASTAKKNIAKKAAKKSVCKTGVKKGVAKIRQSEAVVSVEVQCQAELIISEPKSNEPIGGWVREEVVPAPEVANDEDTTSVDTTCANPIESITEESVASHVSLLPEADDSQKADDALETKSNQKENEKTSVNQKVVTDEAQMVCFSLVEEEFGLDINLVREIIRMVEITGLPECPPYSLGIINLRGKVVDVYDLRCCLGYTRQEPQKDTRIIVLDYNDRLIGLVVDAVTQVLRLDLDEIEATPSLTAPVAKKFLRGIFKQDDKLILLLEPFSLIE